MSPYINQFSPVGVGEGSDPCGLEGSKVAKKPAKAKAAAAATKAKAKANPKVKAKAKTNPKTPKESVQPKRANKRGK